MSIQRRRRLGSSSSETAMSSCCPPPGTTYLTIGQDLFSIQQYIQEQYNASLHHSTSSTSSPPPTMADFAPAAVMAYTDIHQLRGLDTPADYGSGVEYVDGLFDSLFVNQGVGLQLALWLNGTSGCRQIQEGFLDDRIKALFSYLETCRAAKVFLRVGYEFDNPSFGYTSHPSSFVQAFRKIVNDCTTASSWDCRDKVKFVWHSWGASSDIDLSVFYPGNDAVDWVGVSIFQQVYPWASSSSGGGRLQEVEAVLDFAVEHDKPIMIAESTPFGGIDMETANLTWNKPSRTDPWQRWFQPVLNLIDRYDIGMWSYINCDWDSQPMWRGIGFGETRLSSDEYVMEQWRAQVLHGLNRPFLQSGTLVDCSSTNVPLLPRLSKSPFVDLESNVTLTKAYQEQTVLGLVRQHEVEPFAYTAIGLIVLMVGVFAALGSVVLRRYRSSSPPAKSLTSCGEYGALSNPKGSNEMATEEEPGSRLPQGENMNISL